MFSPIKPVILYSTLALSLCSQLACKSAYFSAMESVGYHKRDIMVSRVQGARKSQHDAKQQFKDALEEFRSVVSVAEGTLDDKYKTLSTELRRSEEQASEVKRRVSSVEEVSEALFKEWKQELSEYENKNLRKESERKLKVTREKYEVMMKAMKTVTSKLDPALQPLRDNVLYLKHNLNAEAIGSLQGELRGVESNVDSLILDLEKSIREADSFISQIKS